MKVYFIRAGLSGPVKIGVTADLERRLLDLQCGNHEELHVIRTEPGSGAVEAWLHQRFDGRLIRGEWFHFHPTMLTIAIPAPEALVETPLARAIALVGGQSELARRIDVTQQQVWKWLQSGRPAPESVRAIERATDGRVSRYDLRPDVFGRIPADAADLARASGAGAPS